MTGRLAGSSAADKRSEGSNALSAWAANEPLLRHAWRPGGHGAKVCSLAELRQEFGVPPGRQVGTGALNFYRDRYNLIMMIPTSVRDLAAVAGALLVLSAVASVIGTVIVPRRSGSRLTRLVTRAVDNAFQLVTRPVSDYKRRDRIEAAQAPVILLGQLVMWLGIFYVGYALLVWPEVPDVTAAFRTAGPALWTFGSSQTHGFFETAVLDTAAMAALITVTLQIAYLPQLYGAFNRRETEIALLNSRAGSPSWGPELLARTHYALGSGTSALDTLPELYNQWERWAVDVAESHVTYSPLVWFRSPTYEASWVTSLLAVLDSAALYLSLSPQAAPNVPARLCLRSGLLCFGQEAGQWALMSPQNLIRTRASTWPTTTTWTPSPGYAKWTSRSSETQPNHGRTSWDGE